MFASDFHWDPVESSDIPKTFSGPGLPDSYPTANPSISPGCSCDCQGILLQDVSGLHRISLAVLKIYRLSLGASKNFPRRSLSLSLSLSASLSLSLSTPVSPSVCLRVLCLCVRVGAENERQLRQLASRCTTSAA